LNSTLCLRKKRGIELFMITSSTYNLLLFPTAKEFSNRLTVDEVIAKSLTPRFLRQSVIKFLK